LVQYLRSSDHLSNRFPIPSIHQSQLNRIQKISDMPGFVYRENRVPHYQRLFQKNDGVRQWYKTPRSKMMLYPYFVMLSLGISGSLYGMCRMVMGKKSYF
ncbi:hypothetical protein HOY82DRAFT_478032, partial [Tuber indicum]